MDAKGLDAVCVFQSCNEAYTTHSLRDKHLPDPEYMKKIRAGRGGEKYLAEH